MERHKARRTQFSYKYSNKLKRNKDSNTKKSQLKSILLVSIETGNRKGTVRTHYSRFQLISTRSKIGPTIRTVFDIEILKTDYRQT